MTDCREEDERTAESSAERKLADTALSTFVSTPDDAPRGSWWLRWMLLAHDATACAAAWVAACMIGVDRNAPSIWSRSRVGFLPVVVGANVLLIASNRLYRSRECSIRAVETAALLRACISGGLLMWLVAGRYGARSLHATRLAGGQVLAVGAIAIGRALYRAVLRRARRHGRFTRPVVIVGTGDEAYELQHLLIQEPELGYSVVGVVGRAHEFEQRRFAAPLLGGVTDSVAVVRRTGATGVIVGASSLSFRELNDVVRSLLEAGVHVQLSGGLLGFDSSRLRASPIGRESFFYLEQVRLGGRQSRVKRVLDLALGSVALVISAPIVGVLALLVRRDGGPAIFRQQRIGRDGKAFNVLKLRTMDIDDPRFTRLGRFMDSTSLSQLPQLWNVLRGEMSLVGPRPAPQQEVASSNEPLLQRHRVKPGITGLWQVESRDDSSFADYERCDVFYVENWSVRLDLMIILQTLFEVGRHAVARTGLGASPQNRTTRTDIEFWASHKE